MSDAHNLAGLPFGWGAIFGLLNVLLGGGVVTAWIRTRAPIRKIEVDAEAALRTELSAQLAKRDDRINDLERRIEAERVAHQQQRDAERTRHDGEMSVMRHRANNLDFCLDLLLNLIETDPDKAQDAARRVRQKRAEQKTLEVQETAALTGAKIIAAGQNAPNERSM